MKKALALAFAGLLGLAPLAHAGQFSAGLERLVQGQPLDSQVTVLVVLKDQADVPGLNQSLKAARSTMAERHRTVVDALRATADATQPAVIQEIAFERSGSISDYRPYWLINAIRVTGTIEAIRGLAARSDVDVVEPNLVVELIEPIHPPKEKQLGRGSRAIGITPGLLAIEARRVWEELGIDGTGALVGNMDTGVDGTHPALSARWRGNFAPASECWNDAVGFGDATPVDRHYHGTHVMGTITGLAPNDTIGVAPGALWIADNTINQGTGGAFDSDVLNGLQWFADPDGNSGTTDDVPDVVQNSWGVNEGFSGYFDCDSRWWTAMDNCEAAGVVLTWSAGNEGPGSTSLRSPADRAASPYNAFSVGSTITSPPYTISSFSSRGPSGCGGAYAMKPEVSAPGSDIYSAQPGGGYQLLSGTSMAGPHVAGVVALMRAANPDLDVETVKQILMDTAVDLGTVGEDNTYGHGIINAYEAVLAALSGYGTIEGTVTDTVSGLPVPSATVDVVGDPRTSTADASGFFRILLPEGSWDLEYSAFGHVTDSQTINVIADTVVDGSLALAPVPSATVSGTVIDYNLNPVAGATVSVMGTPLAPATTAGDGTYSLTVPDGDTYTFLGAAAGLGGVQQTVAISGNTTVDFVLPELMAEDFESGGFTSWPWVMSGTAPWTISTTNVHEGSYSARSGVISHNQSSTMEVTVDLAAAGDLSFWYTVSSELSYDFLRFYIDGVQRNSWSGSIGWTQATYAVTAGTHTFRWSYTKDISVNTGSDAAWVDFIDFPPLVSPTPDIAIAPGSISETLAPGGTSSQSLTIDNVGDAQLNYNVSIVGGPLSWLDTSATSGSVPAAGSGSLDVLFDATGLASGPYTATLRLTTNDPDESQVDVPITLDVSGSTDVIVGAQPTAFELANPQPNPFGSATTIAYAIPNEAQAVSIAVYDVAGKLVRTLVNGVQPVGRHVAIWDGRDASGSRVASGVYFTRMDAGEFSDVKKVTLLK